MEEFTRYSTDVQHFWLLLVWCDAAFDRAFEYLCTVVTIMCGNSSTWRWRVYFTMIQKIVIKSINHWLLDWKYLNNTKKIEHFKCSISIEQTSGSWIVVNLHEPCVFSVSRREHLGDQPHWSFYWSSNSQSCLHVGWELQKPLHLNP